MKKNRGATDKAIRFAVAIIIVALYSTNFISGTLALILGILAIAFILTSFISFCPLYLPFGINTNKKRMDKKVNKDLILRERLALQRTVLANQSTFLAFLRTSMYFLVAGLTLRNLLQIENSKGIEFTFFAIAAIVFIVGIVNFVKHKKSIVENKKHIGDYQLE